MSIAHDLVAAAESTAEFLEFRRFFQAAGIRCWLQPQEMALHFGVGAFQPGGGRVVEIGSLEGGSTVFVARGVKLRGKGLLYSIDPHLGAPPYFGTAPYQFTYSKFRQNIAKCKVTPCIRSIVSDSMSAAAIWPAQLIDSLLIDGDHSYLGALKDFECWATKVRPGGLILIDDADDPALPELRDFVEDLKSIGLTSFDSMIDGIAVFRKGESDDFKLLDELKRVVSKRGVHRPWSAEHIQSLRPISSYAPEVMGDNNGLRTAYQLSFLSRCEPGDYGITRSASPDEVALVRALIEARQDGQLITLNPRQKENYRCRLIVALVEDVPYLAQYLIPGGVMIGRSNLELTPENVIAERRILLESKLEACGWLENIHWGIAKPHYLSMEAILEYTSKNMA